MAKQEEGEGISQLTIAARDAYQIDAHAVQSGVKYEIEMFGEKEAAATPKLLRTGINMAMVDSAAIAKLLMDKGVFTEEEYFQAVADGARAEKERYEKRLSERLGSKVTLV